MNNTIIKQDRILSIDIMRGLTLFLMLFVNDLFEPGVPEWLVHAKGNFDGMGLADWVFPGFLFMVGMSVPYAIRSRRQKGDSNMQILNHILIRTISLLIIGILMMNSGSLNPELSGINRNLWSILLYVSVFLIWNTYPDKPKFKNLFLGLKILGVVGLLALAAIFKAGDAEHVSWLVTDWWGILGLIGWGYLVAAITCLLVGSNLIATLGVWIFFISMNILSQSGMLGFLKFLNPVFGVIINGNVPSIVLAGLVISQVLNLSHLTIEKRSLIIAGSGIASLVVGFFLRNWFIISKIQGTPSWGLICDGISMLAFSSLFMIIDRHGKYRWATLFKPAGQNSLTTYLAPDVIYFTVWGLGWPLFFYKQETSQLLAVGGSICWALAMVYFASLLSKINIRLKL